MGQDVNIIQFVNSDGQQRVGIVNGNEAADLTAVVPEISGTVQLALSAIREGCSLTDKAAQLAQGAPCVDYAALWNATFGAESGYLLPPLTGPSNHQTFITGTGLTHTGSMESRDKMHADEAETVDEMPKTDSARMFDMGLQGGKPDGESRGVAPEWFYKGNGLNLRSHRQELEIPAFALDGGEEPELVGCYLVDDNGVPRRLGFAIGNEWSDHATETINYLYLAPSKLRACAVGPELVVGHGFENLDVRCSVTRDDDLIYDSGDLKSGEQYMCHSLRNCEDHHFKYPLHREPGDVHLHFFGTSKLSHSERDWKYQAGDEIRVTVADFSRPLINVVCDGDPTLKSPVRVETC